MATQSFVVQFDHDTVGIAVRIPGGFMFHASERDFEGIDGRFFRRLRSVGSEVRRVGRRLQRMERAPLQKPALA
jgi:hypothetical protein